ncbi:PhzF family phenazine biosynthesis protein [Sulfurimonas sp.]
MKLKIYQIDAFAKNIFEGNPAAVCQLTEWLDDIIMQKIAAENNLAETAFFVQNGESFDLRWFTPTKEVNLCGHATLASAFVIFNYLDYNKKTIEFNSKSGLLKVTQNNKLITMDFPSEIPKVCQVPKAILDAFEVKPKEVLKCVDYIVVFDDGVDITKLQPKLEELKKLDLRGVCITTTDKEYDFVSRFFAPNYGIDEDSVTGSAYTQLTPYWAKRLNKKSFISKQLSTRGGELSCKLEDNRVFISGYGVCYMIGEINIG